MAIRIDNVEMLKEAIATGINLFTGAGFSKLPDNSGNCLPDGNELCDEICERFSVSPAYKHDLEKLSGIINRRAKSQFQEFLRTKYTVTTYNPLYDELNRIKINSFITTNIDNIIQCVMDKSTAYSLHSILEYGAAKKTASVIPFIPLHGNVKIMASNLYFGKSELANVDIDNHELFDVMHSKLLEAPTLFWGYGFHDNAVERTISRVFDNKKQDIWIQCMPGNDNIPYFRDFGCHIIEATTEELFLWIQENCERDSVSSPEEVLFSELKNYCIPSINQVGTVSMQDYYANGNTQWYCVLADYPYETKLINKLYEISLTNKNLISTGIPFSGKTTAMMQLALKRKDSIKLIVSDVTSEEATRIINVLEKHEALVFIDNCCDDANMTKLFMQKPNIRVVGFCDDYAFESSKHLFDMLPYTHIESSDLELDDAQCIYEKIPEALRAREFAYKYNQYERFSMLEMIFQNVNGVLSKDRVRSLYMRILRNSTDTFQVVALATYLTHNKSSLSTDILCSFFSTTDYREINQLLESAKGYLKELNVDINPDTMDQSYYNVRSNLFASLSFSVLIDNYRTEFGGVVRSFIMRVPSFKIYKHHIFKRSAFDARMFKRLFENEAHDLYAHIYHYDGSTYTLQQWALYKAY